jgi:hypothetical protein
MAGVVDVASSYIDLAFNERSLNNARQLRSQILNVQVLNFKLDGPVGSSGEVTFTQTAGGAPAIPQWQVVRTKVSPPVSFVTVQGAAAPGLGNSVTLPVVQGERTTNELLIQASTGQPDQSFILLRRRPVKEYVEVRVNSIAWTRVDDLLDYDGTVQVFEVNYDENMFGIIRFGDDENGKIPPLGDDIKATYVSTSGDGGDVSANSLTLTPGLSGYIATNTLATAGASDGDTVKSIAKMAPQQFNTIKRAVNPEDFEALATQVSGVYSAKANLISSYNATVFIVPTGGGSPSSLLITNVLNYLTPRMMMGTNLTVEGFELAYMWIVCRVRLKSRAYTKVQADNLIRPAVNEELEYDNVEVGSAWSPSDFYALLEGLENGDLVDVVDASVFSRYPRVVKNPSAILDITGFALGEGVGYADWRVTRKNNTQFFAYKDEVYVGEGDVGTPFTSLDGSLTFTVGTLGDTIAAGAEWTFSTSRKVGPVQIANDEFPQTFDGVESYFVMDFYYPDEWTFE